jgi:hypothetical protein
MENGPEWQRERGNTTVKNLQLSVRSEIARNDRTDQMYFLNPPLRLNSLPSNTIPETCLATLSKELCHIFKKSVLTTC